MRGHIGQPVEGSPAALSPPKGKAGPAPQQATQRPDRTGSPPSPPELPGPSWALGQSIFQAKPKPDRGGLDLNLNHLLC